MSAGAVIDSLEFARSQEQLSGTVAVADLKRLEDVLFDTQGILHYSLSGSRDSRNRPQLEVDVKGGLHLQCQRCLGLLDYEVRLVNTLLVVPQGARPGEDVDDPEGPDLLEASTELEVVALIEDEVLLSLPLAPRHPEGACRSSLEQRQAADGELNAFAQLAALKRPQPK